MPAADAFEIVKVVRGNLAASFFTVRPLTAHGPAYPRDLADGKTYTLRLKVSRDSLHQLRENEREGYSFLWLDADEVELHEAEKQRDAPAQR
jgi:hypothetical protein